MVPATSTSQPKNPITSTPLVLHARSTPSFQKDEKKEKKNNNEKLNTEAGTLRVNRVSILRWRYRFDHKERRRIITTIITPNTLPQNARRVCRPKINTLNDKIYNICMYIYISKAKPHCFSVHVSLSVPTLLLT